MAMKEEILATETHKDDGLDVGRRVLYTLVGEQNTPNRQKLQADRNSKAIAVLLKTLHKKHLLTDDQIDEILLEVIS